MSVLLIFGLSMKFHDLSVNKEQQNTINLKGSTLHQIKVSFPAICLRILAIPSGPMRSSNGSLSSSARDSSILSVTDRTTKTKEKLREKTTKTKIYIQELYKGKTMRSTLFPFYKISEAIQSYCSVLFYQVIT